MVFVPFRSIKRAEFAVNVADIRVIDVAIDDIGHDLTPKAAITFRLCQIPSGVRKRAQFLKRPAIQLEHVVCRNPFAREDAFREHISVNRNHRKPILDAADGIRTHQTAGRFCQTQAMDVSQRRRAIHATRRRANRIRDDKEPKSVVRELAAV
jgi:hypothetical protein